MASEINAWDALGRAYSHCEEGSGLDHLLRSLVNPLF